MKWDGFYRALQGPGVDPVPPPPPPLPVHGGVQHDDGQTYWTPGEGHGGGQQEGWQQGQQQQGAQDQTLPEVQQEVERLKQQLYEMRSRETARQAEAMKAASTTSWFPQPLPQQAAHNLEWEALERKPQRPPKDDGLQGEELEVLRGVPSVLPKLCEVSANGSGLRAGEWLVEIKPLISDVSQRAAGWWSRTLDNAYETYTTDGWHKVHWSAPTSCRRREMRRAMNGWTQEWCHCCWPLCPQPSRAS